MLNQVVMVGRIMEEPTIKEMENERKVVNITLAIPRCYKNVNGEYDTDYIDVVLYDAIAENTAEYCKKSDLVGIKGRLEKTENGVIVIAEKVTFLTNNANKDE